MSTLKVNKLRDTSGSTDAIVLDPSGGAVLAGVTTISTARITTGITTSIQVGGGVTISESGIEASGIGITCANINGTQIGGRRNIIINGAMMVAQRGTSATASSGYTTVDRFSQSASNLNNNCDIAQEGLTSGNAYNNGFRKSYKVTNGDNNADSDDQSKINHLIEAQDLTNSGWSHKNPNSFATLSFWVKSSVAQTFSVAIYAEDANMGYGFEYSATTSWTKITHSIPGHASLGINNDNGTGFNIQWYLYMGTDTTSSSFTNADWHTYSGSSRSKDMTTTWQTTNDATFEITGVQLEVGTQATPFEHRSFGEELTLCQRYFEKMVINTYPMFPAGNNGVNNETRMPFKVEKRAAPTVTKSGDLNLTLNGTTSTNTDHNLGSASIYGAKIFAVVSGSNYTSSTAVSAFTCLADAEL
tara:strand:+ start:1244 stop:2491 length:1248 start_codon:yes stop_codon:yes gene_type:complete